MRVLKSLILNRFDRCVKATAFLMDCGCFLYRKDTFNKLGYKTKINTHTTSCINLFLDIYLYSEYRLIYC